MCGICGCGVGHDEHEGGYEHEHEHGTSETGRSPRRIRVEADLLAKNDRLAAGNRAWLAQRQIAAFNVIGSPGAGKTTLLEQTLVRLRDELPLAVLEGDQATDRDAMRIRATGCPVLQINTGTGCHLDARVVLAAVRSLNPPERTLLLIENVGNLVCPSLFDLGERAKVVVMSVTEGEDKPLKYPHIFRAAEVLVLTKTDLVPHVDFDPEVCLSHARGVNPRIRVFRVSSTRGEGMDAWCGWLRTEARARWTTRELEVTPR